MVIAVDMSFCPKSASSPFPWGNGGARRAWEGYDQAFHQAVKRGFWQEWTQKQTKKGWRMCHDNELIYI